MKAIPYGKQEITPEDITAVVEALQADFLTQGPRIDLFEQEFAAYIGVEYAVAVANGTAALHLAALALDVNEKSTVLCTPITFAASANCIQYAGGKVHFADIDPKNYLLDLVALEKTLKQAPIGTFQGVVAVDFAGHAVDLEKLRQLADQFGMWIIEDACHAPGGYFTDSKGEKQGCGNGQFADLAVFSFHPVKHIACGEGGMITTNNKELYERLVKLRTHGITKNQKDFKNPVQLADQHAEGENYPNWYMEMHELGYNYRITDFQAALGSSQLKRADQGLVRRRQLAEKYEVAFEGKGFILGQSGVIEGHVYHLYVIEVENRLALYNHLRENQIYSQIHYFPTHLMPYYQEQGWKQGDLPHAEKYYEHCLSLPMYPSLTDEEQTYVIQTILNFYHG